MITKKELLHIAQVWEECDIKSEMICVDFMKAGEAKVCVKLTI